MPGFWKRLFGRDTTPGEAQAHAPLHGEPAEAAAARAGARVSYALPGGLSQAVVGESHYQPALKRVARGRAAASWDDGLRMTATLMPEPANRYDRHAVAVFIDGLKVGYLPAEVARDYQTPLLRLWNAANSPECQAVVIGGGQRSYGVWLQVGTPELIDFFAAAPPQVQPVSGTASVTVVGEEHYQDILRTLPGLDSDVTHLATLHESVVAKGKYAGDFTAEVRIGGQAVGSLTGPMGARFQSLIRAAALTGKVVGCPATLAADDKRGIQVSLQLPTASELASTS